MNLFDATIEDQYEALLDIQHICRSCQRPTRHIEDARCPRCNGEAVDEEAAERTRRACEKAREEQRKRGRLAFLDEDWHWR